MADWPCPPAARIALTICAVLTGPLASRNTPRINRRPHKIVTDDLPTPFVVDAIGTSLNPG